MEVEVVVQARGPALEAADDDDVGEGALPGRVAAPALGGKALVGAGDHRLVRRIAWR
jgi:hypothetical protein